MSVLNNTLNIIKNAPSLSSDWTHTLLSVCLIKRLPQTPSVGRDAQLRTKHRLKETWQPLDDG